MNGFASRSSSEQPVTELVLMEMAPTMFRVLSEVNEKLLSKIIIIIS